MTLPLISGLLGVGVLTNGVLAEPSSAAGYAREAVQFLNFPGGVGSNALAVNFGPPTSTWGNLTGWALFDSAGNQAFYGALTSTPTPVGSVVSIQAGALTLTLTTVTP